MPSVLLSHNSFQPEIKGAVAYRIHYRSYDLCGKPTESTGLVIAPDSDDTHRKVMTWCHGTTGLGDAACPSDLPQPAVELRTYFQSRSEAQIDYGVPGLQAFIKDGWVVCATDYQGLGTPGHHQYTVNRTNAIDAVTIVHAARELSVGAGTKLGAMGWSQGGGAAASVAELADADFGALELVGSVAMSPGVPISGWRVPDGLHAVLTSGDIPPSGHLYMILAGLQAAFPDDLSLCDVFTRVGIEVHEKNWNIQPVHHLSDILSRSDAHFGKVMFVTDNERLDGWQDAMTKASASREKARCPILVTIDSQNGGLVVPVAWQSQYISDARAHGSEVRTMVYPSDDHFSLPQSCVRDAKDWLAAQFGS